MKKLKFNQTLFHVNLRAEVSCFLCCAQQACSISEKSENIERFRVNECLHSQIFQAVENSIVTVDSGIVWTSVMLQKERVLALTRTKINFPWISFILKLDSNFTPGNSNPRKLEPRANFNQNQFPLDFLHTFTVILPLVTRSNFCFPSDMFSIQFYPR